MSICPKCNWWERICHCKELELFNTTKDRLYNFTDYKNFKTPTEIHGKDHWKKVLKEHGLTDDFDQRPPTQEELQPKKYEPVSRKFIADQISKELYDKGLYHKLVKKRR